MKSEFKETEVESFINSSNERLEKSFCPETKYKCRKDCICFVEAKRIMKFDISTVREAKCAKFNRKGKA